MNGDNLNPDLSKMHVPGELERLRAENEALKRRLDSPRARKLAELLERDIKVRAINHNGETYLSKNDLVFVLAAKAENAKTEDTRRFIYNLIIELNT